MLDQPGVFGAEKLNINLILNKALRANSCKKCIRTIWYLAYYKSYTQLHIFSIFQSFGDS